MGRKFPFTSVFKNSFSKSFSYRPLFSLFICSLLLMSLFVSCDEEDEEFLKELNCFVPYTRVEASKESPATSVHIFWNQCVSQEGYVLLRSYTRDGQTETETVGFASGTTTYTDTTCEPGTEYTYKVSTDYYIFAGIYLHYIIFIPVTSNGNEVKITTATDPKVCIEHPKNLLLSEVEGHTNALKLSWTPCENATYYDVYMAKRYEDIWYSTFEKIKTVSTAECIIEQLYNEEEYYFKVKAFGENETSSLISTWVKGKTPKATNLSMDTAYPVQNGKGEWFSINTDASVNPNWYNLTPDMQQSLWFLISPETGLIKLKGEEKNLMLFSEDGKLLDNNMEIEKDGEYYTYSIQEKFADFKPGKKYYLRFLSYSAWLLVE